MWDVILSSLDDQAVLRNLIESPPAYVEQVSEGTRPGPLELWGVVPLATSSADEPGIYYLAWAGDMPLSPDSVQTGGLANEMKRFSKTPSWFPPTTVGRPR